MSDIIEKIGYTGLIPVVVIDNADLAAPTAGALLDGGLDVMEITMRTEQALQSIRNVRQTYPGMLVGAGTVLSVDQAKEATDSGARFIVAPGFNPELVKWCIDNRIPVIPGCVTPTEIDQALAMGLTILKFFPASIYGGVAGCQALHGPYRMVRFIPTGGIDLQNLSEYADKPFIHAIGGGWLCKPTDINSGNFDAVTRAAKESVDALLGFEMAHIGINAEDAGVSLQIAGMFQTGFGFAIKPGNSSNFAGCGIEVNKASGIGRQGHIAIRTNNVKRATYYLAKRGFAVDWNTRKGSEDNPVAVYLKDEFGGFAVHLLQK